MKIKKLFEDKCVVVLDKPAGVSVHSDGKSKETTVVNFISKNF